MSLNPQALWDQYVSPLGAEFHALFSKSTRSSDLLDLVIKPSAHTGTNYRSIESNQYVTGRADDTALTLAGPDLPPESWHDLTFFTNEMEIDRGRNLAPKQRAVFGQHIVFTFEYDWDDLGFFKEQLGWLLPSKQGPKISKISRLYEHCCQWADFRGICVVWSGSKSLHLHFVLETTTFQKRHPWIVAPYDGIKHQWDDLERDVARILAPSSKPNGDANKADDNLKSPIAYRRLPGGTRILKKPNLLGMPAGMHVPQVVLWENIRKRAPRGVSGLFFSPSNFAAIGNRKSKNVASSQSIGGGLTADEIRYCEAQLRAIYVGYPALHDLTFDAGRALWKARFSNSPQDQNASSIMLETHQTVQVNGSHAAPPPKKLPFPLAAMMQMWCSRYHREQANQRAAAARIISPANDDESDAYLVEAGPLERRFGPQFLQSIRSAVDGEEARSILETHLPDLIEQERISLVRGPEGVAKTGSIMTCHPEIVRRIGQAGLTMYAFADYRNAEEKCAAFNRLGHPGLRGVVWKSFSRAYAEICKELEITPITYADVAKAGHQSLWSEITNKQSMVIDALKARHAAMWKEIGEATPVLFSVHDVAHRWHEQGRTRRLWTKSFWRNAADEGPQIEETRLAFLVHDEIKIRTFCDLVSASVIAWLLAMRDQNPAIWRENHFSLQAKALENYAAIQKSPGDKLIDVAEAKRLLSVMNWDEVTTADTGEYVVRDADETDLDIYARRHGKKWLAAPKRWWREGNRQIADRIVFLTTEAVPTAAARKAHPSIFVVDFETDQVPSDNVETAAKRYVTTENLPDIIEKRIPELREETQQDWSVVSNKIAALKPDLQINAMTHAAARGSNSLIGKNIFQTATFIAAEQYEELQALNAWTGRTDLVLMTHIDELNQSCGRNLRFRRRGRERHLLLINRRLYDLLNASGMFGSLRYRLSLHMDNDDRKNERREG